MIKVFNLLLLLLTALAIPGLICRVRALLAGRKGTRFLQHLYDVRLLLRKGAVYSTTTSALFRATPSIYAGAAMTALLFIPVGNLTPICSFEGDLIAFAYTLALGRVMLILAALDTGSPFEGMGASREALYGALTEPALLLIAGTLALLTGHTSFNGLFAENGFGMEGETIILLMLAFVVICLLFIESGRVPVDDPRTHLELTMIHEVMCLDFCGVDMAFIKVAGWFKTAAFATLAANALGAAVTLPYWWFVTPIAILLTGCSIGIVESTQARNKLIRNTIFIMTVVALAALVFFTAYLLQLHIVLS